MSSPGKRAASVRDERAQVATDLHLEVEIAPALSQTKSEMVPGFLPWMSSCDGAVTIASAMSGTVSDTRAIFAPR